MICRPKHCRRGSTLTLAIIVAIVLTGLIATMAWVAGEDSQQTGNLRQTDQAFYAAEAGAQRVQWYCKKGQMAALTSPLTGSLNSYKYSVTWSGVSGTTIRITSVGSSGKISCTLSQTVTPPLVAPAVASGGDFDNHNIDVLGNVLVGGAYTNAGNGTLTGDLTYYGSATNTGSVTGTVSQAAGTFAPIDMTALGNSLIAAAGKTYSGSQTDVTFDFTAIPTTNKVIYVAGDVTNPTFIGSGTLYATGNVTIGNLGSSANPVNIVAAGNLTTTNNTVQFGSLYIGGTWYRGKFTLTGIVYAAAGVDPSNYAQSTIIPTAAPWFDPRASNWCSVTVVTAFSGPMP